MSDTQKASTQHSKSSRAGNDDGPKPAGYRTPGDGKKSDDGPKPAGYRVPGDGEESDPG